MENILKKRPSVVLFLCLLLAGVGWLVEKLSGTYTHTIEAQVGFVGLPSQYFIDSTQVQKIRLEVRGVGFNMLKYTSQELQINLNVNELTALQNDVYAITPQAISSLNKAYFPNIELKKASPSSIKIPLINKIHKKIPIKVNAPVQTHFEFRVKSQQVIPDSMWVYGVASSIDTLTGLYFKLPPKKNVTHSYSEEIELKNTQYLHYDLSKILLRTTVIRIAEVEFTKVIQVVNAPPQEQIRLLPQTVKVIVTGNMELLKNLLEDDIRIKADYNLAQNGKIPLQIHQKNNELQVHISEKETEYLLY